MIAQSLTPHEIAAQFPADARLHPISVPAYLEMVKHGWINADDRVELIEGWIVEKMAKHQPHNTTQMRMNRWLNRTVPDSWSIGVEVPIVLDRSVPEPDLCILRGAIELYDVDSPVPTQIALVIEVSDSTVRSDRTKKRALYAAAGIVQMWLVDVSARQIEVGTVPNRETSAYDSIVVYGADDTVTLVLDGVTITSLRVSELLPV